MTVQTPTPFPRPHALPEQVAFDRRELGVILTLYGRMVAAGEWRDYGISCLRDGPCSRSSAAPPKTRSTGSRSVPSCATGRGMYAVIGMDGQILKRGHDLRTVLRVLERKLIRPV